MKNLLLFILLSYSFDVLAYSLKRDNLSIDTFGDLNNFKGNIDYTFPSDLKLYSEGTILPENNFYTPTLNYAYVKKKDKYSNWQVGKIPLPQVIQYGEYSYKKRFPTEIYSQNSVETYNGLYYSLNKDIDSIVLRTNFLYGNSQGGSTLYNYSQLSGIGVLLSKNKWTLRLGHADLSASSQCEECNIKNTHLTSIGLKKSFQDISFYNEIVQRTFSSLERENKSIYHSVSFDRYEIQPFVVLSKTQDSRGGEQTTFASGFKYEYYKDLSLQLNYSSTTNRDNFDNGLYETGIGAFSAGLDEGSSLNLSLSLSY